MRKIETEEDVARLTPPVSEHDHAQGPANAPLTLVQYGDYQCPYCREAYPVVKRIQTKFAARLRFVFRNFPLTQVHPYARLAAEAAEAAALQDKFWEMHDQIYEQQEFLAPDVIALWAQNIRLDLDRFKKDMRGSGVSQRIQNDRRSGIRSGVNGTPTFFVNGVRFDGPPDFASLVAALTRTE